MPAAAHSASTRSSSASRRSSSSRRPRRARSHSSRSGSGAPRHSASASPSRYAARSGSPRASSSRARPTSRSNLGVDVVGGHREPVAGSTSRWSGRPTAQPHHAALQHLVPGGRRAVAPHRVGQRSAVTSSPAAWPAPQAPPGPDAPTRRPLVDRQRAEHRDAHNPRVTPLVGLVNGGITAALPPPHRDDTAITDNWVMTTHHYIEKAPS